MKRYIASIFLLIVSYTNAQAADPMVELNYVLAIKRELSKSGKDSLELLFPELYKVRQFVFYASKDPQSPSLQKKLSDLFGLKDVRFDLVNNQWTVPVGVKQYIGQIDDCKNVIIVECRNPNIGQFYYQLEASAGKYYKFDTEGKFFLLQNKL